MGPFGGILVVVFITLLAGAIAYVGDRVGHVVGRRRLSLFGLRPRHTSTIFAIGTGMLIALTVTVFALFFSSEVKTAFFRLGEIQNRITVLQNEAAELDRHTHDENVVVNRGDLMYGAGLILRPPESPAERSKALGVFFDDTVRYANKIYGSQSIGVRGLKPNTSRASNPEVAAKLREVLVDVEPTLLTTPVLVLALADRNLFPHDPIHFGLQGLADRRIFERGAVLASLPIAGRAINPQLAMNQVASSAAAQATSRGLPYYFATPLSVTSSAQIREMSALISRGGPYLLQARAAEDIYPHLGGLPIEFVLVPASR